VTQPLWCQGWQVEHQVHKTQRLKAFKVIVYQRLYQKILALIAPRLYRGRSRRHTGHDEHCLAPLRDTMPDGVKGTIPGGGPCLWVELPERVDRERLRHRLAQLQVLIRRYDNAFLGRPHLNGFRLGDTMLSQDDRRRGIEFWISRPSRLHDRFCYRKQADGTWKIVRLSP